MVKVSNDILKGPFKVSNSHEKFVSVVKEALPEKYEIIYARLISLIEEYSNLARKIEIEDGTNKVSKYSKKSEDDLDELKKEILKLEITSLNISDKLNNIPIDEASYQRQNLMRQKLLIDKVILEKQENVTSFSVQKELTEKQDYWMPELRHNLDSIVLEIGGVLRQIELIKVGNQDRLDTLKVSEGHYWRIRMALEEDERFNAMPEESRYKLIESLTRFLNEYFKLRKASFKLAEDIGTRVIGAFNNDTMLTSNDTDINLMLTSNILVKGFEVSEVLREVFPFDGLSLNPRIYKKISNISKGYSLVSDLSEKRIKNEYSLNDTKIAIDKLGELTKASDFIPNFVNKTSLNYSEIFSEAKDYLDNYEYEAKKDKKILKAVE